MRRYNMLMPQELFDELERVAGEHSVTVMDVMCWAIKLVLILDKIEKSPDTSLIIREKEQERELVLVTLGEAKGE
jgi:hypothetical protein